MREICSTLAFLETVAKSAASIRSVWAQISAGQRQKRVGTLPDLIRGHQVVAQGDVWFAPMKEIAAYARGRATPDAISRWSTSFPSTRSQLAGSCRAARLTSCEKIGAAEFSFGANAIVSPRQYERFSGRRFRAYRRPTSISRPRAA